MSASVMSRPVCLTTRTVYRCLLRAAQRTAQPHFLPIIRAEFRCSEMAAVGTLDDALSILRNLNAQPSASSTPRAAS